MGLLRLWKCVDKSEVGVEREVTERFVRNETANGAAPQELRRYCPS